MGELIDSFRTFILSLSENNAKRWKRFTGDFPMTQDRFDQRLEDLKFTRDSEEKAILWDAFDVKGQEITFKNFVLFVQAESSEIPVNRINSSNSFSPIQGLGQHRRDLIEYCLEKDPNVTGFITQKQLTVFAQDYRIISNPNDLANIILSIDKENTGLVNYFKLFFDITSKDNPHEKPMDPSNRQSKKILDSSIFNNSGSSQPYSSGGARSSLDPTIFGGGTESTHTPSNARKALDPSIFGEKRQNNEIRESTSGARGTLDPSIFGEKPQLTVVRAPPREALDLSKTKDCTEYNMDETISYISRVANSKYRSLRDCFGTWRGNSERLTSEDIYRGIIKQDNAELSRSIIESIVEQYGGELTVSSFTRLISDGARINVPEPVKKAPPPLTQYDILFNGIAEQLKGKQWEPMIKSSTNALDLSRNLKKLGVNIKSEELRGIFETNGIKGIINEISNRQKPKLTKRK